MNLADVIFWILIVFAVFTICLIAGTAMNAVYPRGWERSLHEAGVGEVRRRVAGLGARSQSDHIAASRLIRREPSASEACHENDRRIVEIITILTNLTDEVAVREELSAIRLRLKESALQRQLRLVDRVRSMRVASYLWVAGAYSHRAHFILHGFLWFLPRAWPYVARRLQKYAVASLIAGVVLGLLSAAINHPLASQGGPIRWIPMVSDMGTIATIIALVAAMLGIYKELLVSRFGPPRQWTRRGTSLGAGFVLSLGTTMFLSMSGQWSRWQMELSQVVREIEFDSTVTLWLGGVLFLVYGVHLLRCAYQWIRQSSLTMQDRLGTATAAAFIMWIIVLGGVMVLGISSDLQMVTVLGGSVVIGMAGLTAVVAVVTWAKKLRALRRIGWPVKRWGFRMWAVVAWSVAGFVVPWLGSWAGGWAQQIWGIPILGYAVALFFVIIYALLIIAAIPGAIAALLYVRGVSQAYDAFLFSLAPPHPQRAA